MISNQSIILFSSDDWSSGLSPAKYHVAVGLSKANRFPVRHSVGLRNPRLVEGHEDLAQARRLPEGLSARQREPFRLTRRLVIPFIDRSW